MHQRHAAVVSLWCLCDRLLYVWAAHAATPSQQCITGCSALV